MILKKNNYKKNLLKKNNSIIDAIKKINLLNLKFLIILNEKNSLVGTVTDGDLQSNSK